MDTSSGSVSKSQLIQEFDLDSLIREWEQQYTAGSLDEALTCHWRVYVPLTFSARMNADEDREKRKAKRYLYRPLETFLCGGDPDVELRKLKESDTPPQICGHVFKNGEPTYSCRDCGMDPTCVLCIECFKNSVHRQHRYKMSTSGGGGYCDCGDPEAWKTEPFCDIHKRGLDRKQDKDPVESLPEQVRERAQVMFTHLLRYMLRLLTWKQPDKPPPGLVPEKMDPSYITMLFNDEVHTYEQVIISLQRAISCTHKEAVDFATTVDREGRSSVLDGSFRECEAAKNTIERNTSRHGGKPLKVLVMHTSVIAHQQFAMRTISWLQQLIAGSEGLRVLFCRVAMAPSVDPTEPHSLVEKLMLSDTDLWKSARVQSHQLLMQGVLMDAEAKKQFGIIFTKLYPDMMKAYIEDDHEHGVCAVAESVQLFTVPTLARLLIRERNLLEVILKTFLEHCEAKKNKDGKFAFERSEQSGRVQTFRRAQYALYDFKYALTCKPNADDWDPDLRTNFIKGYSTLLKILLCMQGMDAVTRQTGQHIEFEPEWEGAFNLQLKLADNLTVLLDWCSTDKEALCQAFQLTADKLAIDHDKLTRDTVTVAGHSCAVIKYDVSTQPVSIHLPVSRLLAGLYTSLNKFQLDLQQLHKGIKPDMSELMEPVLRCQVMIAQSYAGMWRRNGYSLLNQIYFYNNVKCRSEMYDRDILLLQACAAMLDPNQFLIHMIHKFGLTRWAQEEEDRVTGQEELIRQIITLAEEMLNLLIYIIGERYVPGVGQVGPEEAVKREIIHQLAIQPMSHSELNKMLPENPCHQTGLEDVVNSVATFVKPTSGSGKGMYKMRPEFLSKFNPYFYHYSRAEQSKSEEVQRIRKQTAQESQALPPPVPPPMCTGFQPILRLLNCDVMLHLIRLVLTRAQMVRPKIWSEMQLVKVLHLIGLALHEEKRAYDDNTTFYFTSLATSGNINIQTLLAGLVNHANITPGSVKDLLTSTIKTFAEVHQLKNLSEAMDTSALPVSRCSDEAAAKKRKRQAEIAAKRRSRIMLQMSRMQRDFIKDNKELFENTSTELAAAGSDMDLSQWNDPAEPFPVTVGAKRSPSSFTGPIRQTCILCQEDQDVTHSDRAVVLAAFVQKSTVSSKEQGTVIEDPEMYDPLFMPTEIHQGAHTTTCGHVMHSDCWQRLYDAIVAKERRRPLRIRNPHLSYDIEKKEFLCPLCETLSNTVIPVVPHLNSLVKDSDCGEIELSLQDWLDGLQKTVKASIQEAKDKESEEESWMFVPCPLSSITKMMAESVAKNFQLLFDYVYDDASDTFSDSITSMLRKFSTDVYAIGLGVHPHDENPRVPIMAWASTAYTIMSVEQCLRYDQKPVFGQLPIRQADCMSALVKFGAVCSQVIQVDLIKKHCVSLLSALLCASHERHLGRIPSLLDFNLFHYLVSLCLSLPTLYTDGAEGATALMRIPTGGLSDHHLLQLVFTAHLVQVLLTLDLPPAENESMEGIEGESETNKLVTLYVQLRRNAGIENVNSPDPWELLSRVQQSCLQFLRCSALFFHYLTGVRTPDKLTMPETPPEEFQSLCSYLSLPATPATLFEGQGQLLDQLIASWCREEGVRSRIQTQAILPYSPTVKRLVTLPMDYSELINRVSSFTCPNSDGDESRAPTMCLVCGVMLCSQSYCCQTDLDNHKVGAATAHAYTCGAGTGLFLRVRECQVLLLCGRSKGSFYSPPYLDEYGETDQGLRRGNPLYLCMERYKKLERLWLTHAIPEEIAHALESNNTLLTIDWQHL